VQDAEDKTDPAAATFVHKKLKGLLSALLVTDENDVPREENKAYGRSTCVGNAEKMVGRNNATVDNRCGWTQASKIRSRTGTRAPVAELMPSEPFHRFSISPRLVGALRAIGP
jgi:hypothetical protein